MLTVVPAYGRDYRSAPAAIADWNAGKDFQIASVGPDMGRYCSRRDKLPGERVKIRFNKLTKFVLVPITS